MDPRTDYSEADTTTTRMYITLYRKCRDEFQFATGSDDDEEVRAYLIPNDSAYGGQTTFGVTVINAEERFNLVLDAARDMGLILETEQNEEYHDSIGEYTGYQFTARTSDDASGEWDVPHLLVVGSLFPEIEDACEAAFGLNIDYQTIPNHFVVYGEGLPEDAKTKLVTAIENSHCIPQEMQRSTVSSIHTGHYI